MSAVKERITKAVEMGAKVPTLTLAIPLHKESGPEPGDRMMEESKTLQILVST
jgi:hypothetical protein